AAQDTGRLIRTVFASTVEILARTGQQRQRTINQSNDFAERDKICRSRNTITAKFPAGTFHQKALFEVDHDRLEELSREVFLISDVADSSRPAGRASQVDHRLERIFTSLREHPPNHPSRRANLIDRASRLDSSCGGRRTPG